jgi:hypothetical protein
VTIRTRMLSRTRLAPGALFLLVLAAAQPAALVRPAKAQTGAEDPTTAMARARFKEGVEYYDKGQFELARAAFLQAYALKKHPAVLLNLAWSCLKSGHALEAERYFRQFLSEGREISDKQRADANDGLNQTHAKLGRIEVSAPTGTEVTIDGERAGTAPIADLIPVEAGAHTVKFKGPDGATETDSVSVMGGEKVVARYNRTTVATTTAPSPPPAPPVSEPSPPAPPISQSTGETTPPEAAPPRKEHPTSGASHSAWAAPSNPWPSIIMWSLAAVSGGVAGYTAVVKSQAQDHANQTAASIVANAGSQTIDCNNLTMGQQKTFGQACSDYNTDNNDVNLDATVANLAIGVGAGLFVGGFLYWFLADKGPKGGDSGVAQTPTLQPVVVPVIGHNYGALSVTCQF